jgi:hypothetical protein
MEAKVKRKGFIFPALVGFFIYLSLFLFSPAVFAGVLPEEEGTDAAKGAVPVFKVPGSPVIDGVLDEEAWQGRPLQKDFITHEPVYGEKLPYETLVWTAYDRNNLYFAFRCFDPDPGRIQTSLTKRDNMFSDDWVSVSIDASGGGQTAYVLYVNPGGIQGDALASAVGGEDTAPDFVWESAAKVTEKGWQVEICLPLKSIRFKTGKEVRMGILFRRRITRLGYLGSWPDIPPGHGILNRQTEVIFKDLEKQLRLEVLPSLTHGDNRERVSADEWVGGDTFTQLGIGLKYGLTSSITADITVNPDFSQVESDAFQVEVNQRYPLFYTEKRPFFMEGADIFKFYTFYYGYLPTAVHTRQIADPAWGAKLTGSQGNVSFGILCADDELPGRAREGEVNPGEGKNAFFGIARGKYSLGKDNYIGVLYSGREFAGEYNRVFGADLAYRIGKNQRINASFLHSISGSGEGREGNGAGSSDVNFVYTYDSKPLGFSAAFEHIGRDFRMDSSYMLRRGLNDVFLWLGIGLYPESKKIPWLKMISPDFVFQYTHDLYTGMDDLFFRAALYFITTREGLLVLNYRLLKESWQGREFNDMDQLLIKGEVRLSKWLKIAGEYLYGEKIYYEGTPAFTGIGSEVLFSVDLQPNRKINQYCSFIHTDLSRAGEKIYKVNILYSRTTYQFSKYFFLRAVIQHDSFRSELLTDFLASFTLVPGTVLHVGYGGLYENRKWQDNRWLYGEGEMINTRRSLFAKISYLWRF